MICFAEMHILSHQSVMLHEILFDGSECVTSSKIFNIQSQETNGINQVSARVLNDKAESVQAA